MAATTICASTASSEKIRSSPSSTSRCRRRACRRCSAWRAPTTSRSIRRCRPPGSASTIRSTPAWSWCRRCSAGSFRRTSRASIATACPRRRRRSTRPGTTPSKTRRTKSTPTIEAQDVDDFDKALGLLLQDEPVAVRRPRRQAVAGDGQAAPRGRGEPLRSSPTSTITDAGGAAASERARRRACCSSTTSSPPAPRTPSPTSRGHASLTFAAAAASMGAATATSTSSSGPTFPYVEQILPLP